MWPRICLAGAAVLGLLVGNAGVVRAQAFSDASPDVAARAALSTTPAMIEGCILAAAQLHHLPPALLVILLNVERGAIGHVSHNTNDTVDIGPMQVNQVWLPQLARHWNASISTTFLALRDNFCANVEGGAWILRQALDEAHGDFWQGVAIYHSHDPGYQRDYLGHVLSEVERLDPASRSAGTPMRVAGG
jgi:hypothetical protein